MAVAEVANLGFRAHAALGTRLAAEIVGLEIGRTDLGNTNDNATRFVIMARAPNDPDSNSAQPTIMSFFFETQSLQAALHKALGGLSTNDIDLLRPEGLLVLISVRLASPSKLWVIFNEAGVQNALRRAPVAPAAPSRDSK